jgi:hypothetical protein
VLQTLLANHTRYKNEVTLPRSIVVVVNLQLGETGGSREQDQIQDLNVKENIT